MLTTLEHRGLRRTPEAGPLVPVPHLRPGTGVQVPAGPTLNLVLPAVASCEGCPFWASDFMLLVIPTSFLFASAESNLPQKGGLFAPFHRWGPQRVENGNSECLHYTITPLTSGTRNTLTSNMGQYPRKNTGRSTRQPPPPSAREGWPKRTGSARGHRNSFHPAGGKDATPPYR